MFVKVCGFGGSSGICLPVCLRNPLTNCNSVVLALVRWLSPHPDAILRDSEHRPVCPSPFDINHALWTFTKLPRHRDCFNGIHFERQLDLFDGYDDVTKRANANELKRARYDLIQLESIEKFMNCTAIDNDSSTIMETITLPFVI